MKNNKEFILCAAVWYNDGQKHDHQPKNIEVGFVVTGRRHSNCYATVKAIAGMDEAIKLKVMNVEARMSPEDFKNSQGFITSLDRYVNRKEAWKIAKEMGQIQFGLEAYENREDSILYSENLY